MQTPWMQDVRQGMIPEPYARVEGTPQRCIPNVAEGLKSSQPFVERRAPYGVLLRAKCPPRNQGNANCCEPRGAHNSTERHTHHVQRATQAVSRRKQTQPDASLVPETVAKQIQAQSRKQTQSLAPEPVLESTTAAIACADPASRFLPPPGVQGFLHEHILYRITVVPKASTRKPVGTRKSLAKW